MNEKAILELAKALHISYTFSWNPLKLFRGRLLTAKEILETFEYKTFKKLDCPEVCRLIEESEEVSNETNKNNS